MDKMAGMIGFSIFIGLIASGTAAEETVYIRGKVVSSNGNGTPVDSAIVRLLNDGRSVYSAEDGSFAIGDRVVGNRRPGRAIRSTAQLCCKNGKLVRPGGFPHGGRISFYDLLGKHLETRTCGKSTGDLPIDIQNTATDGSRSGNFIVTVSANTVETAAYYLVTCIDNRVSSLSSKNDGAIVRFPKQSVAASAVADTLHLWKAGYQVKKIPVSNLIDSIEDVTLELLAETQTAPVPLFRDPVCDGAADPTIIWNREEKAYWIFYTNRRATCCQGCSGVEWVFGTNIGITSSFDGGATWQYRGVAKLTGKDDLNWNDEKNTFWAIEVIYDDGVYHMYASITPGILRSWNESIAGVVHLSATDPLNGWSYDDIPYTRIHQGIDPTVHKLDDGKWYMWGKYSDVQSSTDLVHWDMTNLSAPRTGEAPYVFYWKDYYWIIWDPTSGGTGGLVVKRSTDGKRWTTQSTNILSGNGTRPGERNVDGKHCSVAVLEDRAYIIYFAQGGDGDINAGTSCLQAAPLSENNGVLSADRNEPFEFILDYYDDPMNEGR